MAGRLSKSLQICCELRPDCERVCEVDKSESATLVGVAILLLRSCRNDLISVFFFCARRQPRVPHGAPEALVQVVELQDRGELRFSELRTPKAPISKSLSVFKERVSETKGSTKS